MEQYSEKWIEEFSYHELSDHDACKAIYEFVTSYDIRCGEYEGNSYVIKKIDRENFIIFLENQYPDGHIEIPWAIAIYKNQLLNILSHHICRK